MNIPEAIYQPVLKRIWRDEDAGSDPSTCLTYGFGPALSVKAWLRIDGRTHTRSYLYGGTAAEATFVEDASGGFITVTLSNEHGDEVETYLNAAAAIEHLDSLKDAIEKAAAYNS